MSKNYKDYHKRIAKKYGSAIEHGLAHAKDHDQNSRRNFLKTTGLTIAGTLFTAGQWGINGIKASPLLNALGSLQNDRILVLIRLNGGNDGLNTVIPRFNDEYYNIRPNLGITEPNLWNLDDDFGMPNYSDSLESLWQEGSMKVIHNVGYPEPDYSHFRSSDIWATGSSSDKLEDTGWIGRFIESDMPVFKDVPPSVPPALQIGVQTNLLFTSGQGSAALAVTNPTEFYQIASTGQLYETESLGNIEHEKELSFLRDAANNAFRYSESIQNAFTLGQNTAEYPDTYLAEEMAIVARMIKGQLGTKIYMVSIGGFDTHADQDMYHPELLTELSGAIKSFFTDLKENDQAKDVLAMTFSEFGRTVFENGSSGTDHGTSAPMLLFNEGMGNGFHGTPIDLLNLDMYGDPFFDVDFRQVYSTILKDWLGINGNIVNSVMKNDFGKIEGLVPALAPLAGSNGDQALLGHKANDKNPHFVEIRYSIQNRGNVRLSILDENGVTIRRIFQEFKEAGSHIYMLNPKKYLLDSGTYIYKLETGGRIFTREFLV